MTIKELCNKYGISLEELGDIGEISDGYHTFNSLYRQRCILFAALCNTFKTLSWKSRKHSDGEECFGGGWFIVGIETSAGTYTYHYENEFWDLFKCQELDVAKEWDGHTDKDVERLLSLNKKEYQSDTCPPKVWISPYGAMSLINAADNYGHVLFECRGLSPVEVIISNIKEVRIMVNDAAKTNDEIFALLNPPDFLNNEFHIPDASDNAKS